MISSLPHKCYMSLSVASRQDQTLARTFCDGILR
jgi:hypothetical protein